MNLEEAKKGGLWVEYLVSEDFGVEWVNSSMDTKGRLIAGSHNRNEFVLINADETARVSGLYFSDFSVPLKILNSHGLQNRVSFLSFVLILRLISQSHVRSLKKQIPHWGLFFFGFPCWFFDPIGLSFHFESFISFLRVFGSFWIFSFRNGFPKCLLLSTMRVSSWNK